MSETTTSQPDMTARPRPVGKHNANPPGISFLALIAEDFATHDRHLLEPGFWAIAVHRFGNWRKGIKPRLVELPFSLLYWCLYIGINWLWGIDLSYAVRLGRRVRIWHHGGIVIGARSIGDDVHIRQNTTMGLLSRLDDESAKPAIEDRVDIGVGACILGHITVGHDTVIGANTVVVKDVPPHSTVFGIPARPVKLLRPDSNRDAP
jgi:serine O-acetyltransferase